MDWIVGIQRAIDYIEDNLNETIDYEEAAKKWLANGAQPTEVVGKIFKLAGITK